MQPDPDNSIVPTGGKLPLSREMNTSQLLDFLLALDRAKAKDVSRKTIQEWLSPRTRPGFYCEMEPTLHLAYADQRDGPNTIHWWRLYFDRTWQEKIDRTLQSSALATVKKINGKTEGFEWGGMMFRSPAEVKIADALYQRGVLFFANARGRVSDRGSPVSRSSGLTAGRLEVDFLVFHRGKCISLEVDGKHHEKSDQAHRDYIRDRLLLGEGIPTARFTASECFQNPDAVIEEFLNMF
ncbi:DUF559 domain-containing protein [Pannus brasiliensis CCIBt3594]|uniref:DUF559 domain-containing protein n=1 Tax=Pannus brasiliensis CCIBt3594 TaxID=1427578 RepID=A0AAW9R1S8_9CHRO